MKLRIKGNTIRLRLSEPEVNILASGNSVSDRVVFASTILQYEVVNADRSSVDFVNSNILVKVETNELEEWARTDKVTISFENVTSDENKLSILVEKDFKCLSVRPGEDETDLYPNLNKHNC